jgi:D-amino-acid dehydrogenase
MLSPEELFTLEPSIRKDIVGGAIFNVDGWLNPMKLYADIKKINQSQGVQFVSGTVLSFSNNADCIEEVKMESQGIGGDLFVLCSGARSVILAQKLGINLPMVPGKGYNLTTSKKIENQPKRPIYMCERKVVATPWSSGFRLGSTMEFAGFDLSLNEVRINALLSASREYLDVDLNREDFKPWAGWRPMSSSEVPIIEVSGKFSNLIIATGHGMLGLSMAPATGMAVKMLIENA